MHKDISLNFLKGYKNVTIIHASVAELSQPFSWALDRSMKKSYSNALDIRESSSVSMLERLKILYILVRSQFIFFANQAGLRSSSSRRRFMCFPMCNINDAGRLIVVIPNLRYRQVTMPRNKYKQPTPRV